MLRAARGLICPRGQVHRKVGFADAKAGALALPLRTQKEQARKSCSVPSALGSVCRVTNTAAGSGPEEGTV